MEQGPGQGENLQYRYLRFSGREYKRAQRGGEQLALLPSKNIHWDYAKHGKRTGVAARSKFLAYVEANIISREVSAHYGIGAGAP
jgi:hypothetical protein